jgi:hypothetical protein
MNIRRSLWLALFAVQAFGTVACSATDAGFPTQAAAPIAAAPARTQGPAAAPAMQQGQTELQARNANAAGAHAVDIVDATGFDRPIVAAVAEIPADWQTQGGVHWNRRTNCVTNQLQLAWRATSRDGTQVVEILPGFNWQVQGTQIDMNPCPAMPFATVRDFLAAVVQQNRAGARVLAYRDRPDLVPQSAPAAQNPRTQTRQEAGQMLIGYAFDGREVREALSTTVAFSNASGNIVAGTGMVFAQRAPAGTLDFALGDRIAKSIHANPQWLDLMRQAGTQAVDQYAQNQSAAINDWNNRQMAAISANGAAARAAISANTLRDVAAINSATYQNTQATNDHIQAQTLEGIGEYNRYRGTDGGEVRSSIHGGDRVLQTTNGDAFSTSDPYFHPAGTTELERVP